LWIRETPSLDFQSIVSLLIWIFSILLILSIENLLLCYSILNWSFTLWDSIWICRSFARDSTVWSLSWNSIKLVIRANEDNRFVCVCYYCVLRVRPPPRESPPQSHSNGSIREIEQPPRAHPISTWNLDHLTLTTKPHLRSSFVYNCNNAAAFYLCSESKLCKKASQHFENIDSVAANKYEYTVNPPQATSHIPSAAAKSSKKIRTHVQHDRSTFAAPQEKKL
jgi:hypothetical protein